MQTNEGNRLLLELEKLRRDVNRQVMNPPIPALKIADLKPVVTLAAQARLSYIEQLLSIGDGAPDFPSPDKISELAQRREAYEELRAAVNALETAIERGYLDVSDS
ncbi:MAG: hypothetical protein AAF680_11995 [Pseudomonadota bacterium]